MTVLLMRLAAPLQSWGVASRFARRETQQYPSKSGILGLIAAARGHRRTDPIEEALQNLAFGVRVDQPGRLIRDFQVALNIDKTKQFPLSQRYYLADAVFLAAIQGERGLIEGIGNALRRPEFPLYLGRRSCPVTGPLVLGEPRDITLEHALHETEWQAATWYRRSQHRRVRLPIYRDLLPGDPAELLREQVRDMPLSFDPIRREYGWRTVVEDYTTMLNAEGRTGHEPLAALGGD
ncbi:type I-E CRISPR-associated protein Cas5/CasD [Nocardia farcinica]|uniref:type I-E CRISPR-associated protein Cas5/CasD n=1 Tax=Nocardia farcinica TaxID=37329 RepID=UPI000BF3C3B3|nr:type I-E CRISPR-associated protein Cas5/CasD [Nocardia farcinica]MBF6141322.1 type I-E CRISPR-associated protein Cas5/CasD [Nocardia farcinica]MBF6230469.1 type I-E CRISPR-associated protein Cas5/CasD [Nocardia farcinica]MBF6260125.1 type I-E CRISPR-associated protein Cas5/CasD [Nocardia farcinica]MBF6535925.1 type I-E CRISPR-associated protein Cas5/CasD [Nocardia farcinica]